MKKTLKWIAIVAGVLVVLLVVAAIVVLLTFNPNKYKGQIAQAVKAQTGRELTFKGPIGLKLFPWIGVKLGPVSLSNAPGFGRQPFASIEAAGVRVAVLPLLRKRIEVDTVYLDGLKLNLMKNRAGQNNWADLTTARGARPAPAPTTPAGAGGAAALAAVTVGHVDIRSAEVVWQDQQTGATYTVHDLRLRTGRIAVNEPVRLDLGFDLVSSHPKLRTRVTLTGEAKVNLDRQTLALSDVKLDVGPVTVKADVDGQKILDAPRFSGRLQVPTFNPRDLLKLLGQSIKTADASALTRLSVSTRFAATPDEVRLTGLSLKLDDSTLTGAASVRNFARPALGFDLALDRIDADRYLPPPAPKGATPAARGQAPTPVVIPLAPLRTLDADGRLRIGSLRVAGIRSSDIVVTLKAKNGLIDLGPSSARLYDGRYSGQMRLDARAATPQISVDETLSGVQLGPFLKDAKLFTAFTGAGDVRLNLATRGLNAEQMTRNLNGSASFMVRDGTLLGVDLQKIRDATSSTFDALTKNRNIGTLAALATALPQFKPEPGDKTPFSQLQASARIRDGVVDNNDLALVSPALRVHGNGQVNLVRSTFDDYHLTVGTVPFIVSGPFTGPRILPDTGALWRQFVQRQEKQLGQELRKKAEEKLKQELLKGLFK